MHHTYTMSMEEITLRQSQELSKLEATGKNAKRRRALRNAISFGSHLTSLKRCSKELISA